MCAARKRQRSAAEDANRIKRHVAVKRNRRVAGKDDDRVAGCRRGRTCAAGLPLRFAPCHARICCKRKNRTRREVRKKLGRPVARDRNCRIVHAPRCYRPRVARPARERMARRRNGGQRRIAAACNPCRRRARHSIIAELHVAHVRVGGVGVELCGERVRLVLVVVGVADTVGKGHRRRRVGIQLAVERAVNDVRESGVAVRIDRRREEDRGGAG